MLLCIDIGNTHTHFGVVEPGGGARSIQHLPTGEIEDPARGLGPQITRILAESPGLIGIAFCSVVPAASERIFRVFAQWSKSLPVFQLTAEKKLGVPIGYPNPKEIGQDRLANAAGAKALGAMPAVVIDLGTAVTFDIVTRGGGYEGGIIAPGVELMRRYLHEQTALLPALDDSLEVQGAIGHSTVEAMRIGTVIGFGGMIQALLDAVIGELTARGESPIRVIATGGSAELLKKSLRTPFEVIPDLTLRGLAVAWKLNEEKPEMKKAEG
jgi:type III pantothenate kinase